MSFRTVDLNSQFLLKVILKRKKSLNLTYKDLSRILKKKEVHIASILAGQHSFEESDIKKIYNLFGLHQFGKLYDIKRELTQFPVLRNQNFDKEKNDPTIARLNEIVKMYGFPIKNLIEEKCGNGIMSAIDCKLDLDLELTKDGNKRLILKIDSKFLEYCPS